MAESFVFDTANSLLGKLASYAYEEASRAYGVYDDLQGVKSTLSIVNGLLLDADEKKNHQPHALGEWLRQIRNICYDAEDVLDGFELQDKREKFVKASASTRGKVSHFFSSSNPLAFRFRMSREIKAIRERLNKVANDGTKFGLIRISNEPKLALQRKDFTHSHVDASSIIGREKDVEEIIKLLIEPNLHGHGDKGLFVIPIVGVGGLGKTTLAKLVFNDNRIDKLFQLKIWVCVSNDFDINHIIKQIINSSLVSAPTPLGVANSHQEDINNFEIEQLQICLRQKLSSQKFLLVLDDIWKVDRTKWIDLRDLINVGSPGSIVMVTTRNSSIASMMGTVSPYDLKGLSNEDCLYLFVKWAFKEGEEEKHPNLVQIGNEIVKKCVGVPLAVRTLGSSLFLNFNISRWEFVRDSEMWNLDQEENGILPALKLSYDQMPSYLKKCFPYFLLFPKGYCFKSFLMCSLWISHGLVQSLNESETLESIARKYIDELHSRSFLHDLCDYESSCEFKVHDLIHDLAFYVAREEFLMVNSHTQMNIPQQVRHLSFVDNNSFDHYLFPKSTSLRSILLPFYIVGLESEKVLGTWLSRYKYLRYLDLSNSSFETMPNSIAKLEHLCFLDISHNKKIKRLPNFICKLLNLQALLLKGCTKLENLPKGLGNLISLRRLIVTTKQSILSLDELSSLNHLQTLMFYNCNNLKFSFRQQLPSIQELYLEFCGSLECLPLNIFPNLQTLGISYGCGMLNLSLNNESPIPKLRIKYFMLVNHQGLLALPEWIVGTVDTLETLVIDDCPNLKTLPECLTRMSNLKRIHIRFCPQLLCLPSDMHCLTALEELTIFYCPELCPKCQPQSGEYWPMISHIKNIKIPSLEQHIRIHAHALRAANIFKEAVSSGRK